MSGLATVDYADIEWESDGTPRSRQFNDVYFSRDGGLAESCYVYLQGNAIPERWSTHFATTSAFHLFEAGFGTGLNFLLTCRAFLAMLATAPRSTARLRYVAVERYPLRKSDLQKALAFFPELAELADALLRQYPPGLRGWHSLTFAEQRVELLLLFDDITDALPALQQTDWRFDAWYLDGFAPARNEAMWADQLWPAIQRLSRGDATASTFSAAGEVRRGLQSAGFQVEKIAGFGRKRDMTRARLLSVNSSLYHTVQSPTDDTRPAMPALIIGAGIAGAATARMLAARGVAVTVIDQQHTAGGTLRQHDTALASPRWSRDHNLRSRFQLAGFLQLLRWAETLGNAHHSIIQQRTILTLLEDTEREREWTVLSELGLLGEFAEYLEPGAASERAGVMLRHHAVQQQLALTVSPQVLCEALLQHPLIDRQQGHAVKTFQCTSNGVSIALDDNRTLTGSELILACGADSLQWLGGFPLRPVRGQNTPLPATTSSATLKQPLRFGGYLTPALNGTHNLGASYDGGVWDPTLRAESQQQNLDALAWAVPELAASWSDLPVQGEVGHRLVTADRSPLIGAHPIQPHLWLNLAHGSHALMTACIGAQVLVSQILGEPESVPAEQLRAITPARFRRHLTAN
jgi:tRNA 5-methylaminomethyl-2-thiouridine biosynthesis bifunctional protein